MTSESKAQQNQEAPSYCKRCGEKSTKSAGEDAPSKCCNIACVLIFVGEIMSQSIVGSSGWYTLSDHAVEGLGRLCLDLGYDLYELGERLTAL